MDISVARDAGAFDRLHDEWDALLAVSPQATVYQSWEWNEAWWRAFGRRKRLSILELREGGRLIGLAPFYVSRHLGTPLRRLAWVGTGPSDYLDVLCGASDRDRVAEAVLEWAHRSGEHDLADLQQLRAGCNLLSAASHLPQVEQEPCPTLPLTDGWEGVIARLGRNQRSQIGSKDRRIARHFEDFAHRVATADTLSGDMAALFDLHSRRWRSRLLPGVLGSPRVQEFHREIAARFLGRGWLRLHTLYADGRIVSALYCYVFNGRYCYYLSGFDPAMGRFSPGDVVIARAIRDALDMNCTVFDFLRGAEPYKYRWKPENPHNVRVFVPGRSTTRARAMLQLNAWERSVEDRAKRFAEQCGRKSKP